MAKSGPGIADYWSQVVRIDSDVKCISKGGNGKISFYALSDSGFAES